MAAWSGYDAANWSAARGYVYFPTLDSKRDLDSFTGQELRKRSRWIYVNVGLGTRCADGIANMVGALTPVPLTAAKEWNQLVLKSFNDNAYSAQVFDVAGKFHFGSCQPMMSTLRLIDGDILPVFTESQSGIARVMFYEAHQIGNAETSLAQDQWFDGVRATPQGAAIAYRILTDDGKKSVDIPAQDAAFHCNYRRPGRMRGEPAFRHAINHFLDRSEILGFLKVSSKNSSQIGYQVVSAPGFSGPNTLPAFGQGPVSQTQPDGVTKIMVEEAYRGGKIPAPPPGQEIKMLLDERPHPNQLEILDHLVRDMAWGFGCSPDILWNIAKLGGATARYVLADAQQTLIEPAQELLADQFCSRFYIYFVAKEMKRWKATSGAAGIPPCPDPEWWKHGWQPQQKLTVDIGRDGKLFIDMHKSGMITLKRYHAALGQNWQQETNEYLDERQYIIQGVNSRTIKLADGTERPMTMQEAYPPEPGSSNTLERTTPANDPTAGGDPNAPDNTPTAALAKE